MRYLIILAAIGFMSFTLKTDELNTCNGFEKFTFGKPKESFKNLTLEIEEGISQLYNVNTKEVNMPGVEFEYIRISFINNKLSTIAFLTKNATRGQFLKFLKDNYGTPAKTNRSYEWVGKKVKIIYEPYKNSHDAAIDFYSRR